METIYNSVLLIDDNSLDNYLNKINLEIAHFTKEIFAFESALKALDFLEKTYAESGEVPDIIFLDINMPVMSGFDFLDKFKNLPESIKKKVKIIMLSSSIDAEEIKKAKANPHVRQFISKPLTSEKIQNLMEMVY